MSLDYRVYYRGDHDELQASLDGFFSESDRISFFSPVSVSKTKPIFHEILRDMGYIGPFPVSASFRVSKEYVSEATEALKVFRDTFLTREKSIFLLNGETELSE